MINLQGCAIEEYRNLCGSGENVALVHQVNCQGVMGSGIAAQIREEFPMHYEDYRDEFESGSNLLGTTVITDYSTGHKGRYVVGVYGQKLYGTDRRHTNYAALFNGLTEVADTTFTDYIVVPKFIGCGLAGGDWNVVELFLRELEDMYGNVFEFVVVEFNQ